tara:strand:- start:610 stop:4674 length:4065 start_codon:yes stop_codon:yes gene_type:complete
MVNLQILDIGDDDVNFEYIITLYCRNDKGDNVICHVNGFNPSFYVRVPDDDLTSLKTLIKKALTDQLEKDVHRLPEFKDLDNEDKIFQGKLKSKLDYYTDPNCSYYCKMKYSDNIIKNKSFYNFSFNENETFLFYKLEFTSNFSMMKYINAIKKYYHKLKDNYHEIENNSFTKRWLDLKESNCDCEANLYESKVSPILKFIHTTNINSCGWININKKHYKSVKNKVFNCLKEYDKIYYKNIIPVENDEISNFKILSFDIECDSSHGDFPNPKKDFKKLVDEIYDYIKNVPGNTMKEMLIPIINKCISWAFNNNEDVCDQIKYSISKIYTDKKYDNLNDLNEALESSELFKDLNQLTDNKSRNKILKELYKIFENNLKYRENQDAEIPIRKKISVLGDPIIQIGNVYYDYVDKIFQREIIVFKDNVKEEEICNNLENIDLIRCSTEEELLIKWSESLIKNNPDYITGYNIFGFDFNFIIERADILFKCPSSCKCTTYENNETGKKTKYVDHCESCPKNKFYKIGRILENNKKLYRNKECRSVDKELSSSGLGDNVLKFIHMDGRILFDMQKEIQKGHPLESYKLDNVSSHFMKGKVKIQITLNINGIYTTRLSTKNTGYLKNGDYIGLNVHTKWGTYKYEDKKFIINKIIDNTIFIESEKPIIIEDYEYIEWCLAKDDISPKDIFCCHKNNTNYTLENGLTVNGPEGRAMIAKYCVMDCELVIHLVVSLDIIPNNIGMANVCSVPQSFIFLRGQGVKVNSLITKWCSQNNIRIPTLQSYDPNNKEGFEGAIVLDPEQRNTTGMYLEDPVAVVDYASLYPSSIIENNFSHETFICTEKDYLENPEKYNHFKEEFKEHPDWYTKATYGDYEFTEKFKKNDNIIIKATGEKAIIDKVEKSKEEDDDTKYYIIKNEKYTGDELYKENDKQWDKHKLESETTCYFKSQFYKYDPEKGPTYGIIPTILKTLLDERKATKKRIKTAETDDKKKVYECLQLQYKLTANSVYGQLGAKTSSVFFKKIAACTTAIGRQRIYDAENGTIEWAEKQTDYICTDENIVKKEDRAKIVYGDTDSVFIKFSRYNKDGNLLTGPEAIAHCIECGKQAGLYVTEYLLNPNFKGKLIKDIPIEKTPYKGPQDLEYEKTFENFILISKKRYIGDKHEMEYLTDPKRTSMGIVMKRRDNAPIVKYVYGNILEILMKQKNVELARQWLKDTLLKISKGEMSKDNIDMFVITKSLRGYYKNPESIAHKVLADRIAERDPGNKPKPNDRIPYAYFELEYNMKYDIENKYKSGKNKGKDKKKTILQGNRIEHRDYIIDKKLNLDYNFYITNQIMKPVSQLLEIQLGEKEINEIFKNYID